MYYQVIESDSFLKRFLGDDDLGFLDGSALESFSYFFFWYETVGHMYVGTCVDDRA